MRFAGLGLGAFLISLTAASVATANGRFPRAQRLQIDPEDPNHMVVFATYGLVKTSDGGKSWWQICESATGTYNGEGALFDFMADGTYLSGADASIKISPDKGCDWVVALPPRDNAIPEDFSVDPADRSKAMAIVNISLPMFEYDFEIQESTDNGKSWTVVNTEIPASYLFTLDFAASDPNRFYLSGWNTVTTDAGVTQTPIFLRNNARGLGAEWTVTDIGGASGDLPFIAKVAPDDADQVFVRMDSWGPEEDGLQVPFDALFYTRNGGATFKEVLRQRAKLFGFALSPDGKTVLAGYGNIRWPSALEDENAFGLYKANVADLEAGNAFTRIYDKPVSCITWTADALYVCTSQTDALLEIGKAPNADFTLDDANPLEPILKLPCVDGPLDCPADTAAGKCSTEADAGWPTVCPLIGKECNADSSVCKGSGGAGGSDGGAGGNDGGAGGNDGGAGGSDGGDGGTGATGAMGGTGATGATGATGGTGGTGTGGNASGGSDDDGGCALSAPKGGTRTTLSALGFVLLLLGSFRRRTR